MALINDSFKTLPQLFDGVFKHYKGKTRYPLSRKNNGTYEGISYDQLSRDVEWFGAYLRSIGVEKGDRVAILSENRPAWVTADMAILKIGAIDVPLYPSLPPNQISYILQNSDSKAVIVSTQLQLNKIRKIISEVPSLKQVVAIHNIESPQPNEIDFNAALQSGKKTLEEQPDILKGISISEEDLATLIYTSGTTGNPKGVMLTHRNICENVKSCSKVLNIDENDASLSFLPLCHAYERTAGYYLMFACGVPIYYAESIETVSMNISEVKPTVVITVPRLFERIRSTMLKTIDNSGNAFRKKMFHWALDIGYKHLKGKNSVFTGSQMLTGIQYKLADTLVFSKIRERFGGRIRFFVSGGAALPKETGEFFQVLGITILEGFGLTETSPVTHVNRPGKVKFGTVGPPVANVDVKIAHDGEILLRGPNIMKGYWQDEAATAESIIDGWLHTGDIGEIDKDGYLKITDRKKHIIVNSGGKNIAPLPIENLITQNQYVDQVLVVGEKRPFLVALIVPNFDFLKDYAEKNGISFTDQKDLLEKPQVLEIFDTLLRQISRELASHEKVRKYLLVAEAFTVESGNMTPTLKLKRRQIEKIFQEQINELYKGLVYEAE